jgi:hypothetical protein
MSKRKKQPAAESRDYTARYRHHMTPKSRGGDRSPENLLLLKIDRHFYWHKLFGSRTLEEVIRLLLRVHQAKGRCLYAHMGLYCRSAACLAFKSGGNGRTGKESGEQMRASRNNKGKGNQNYRVLRQCPGKPSRDASKSKR